MYTNKLTLNNNRLSNYIGSYYYFMQNLIKSAHLEQIKYQTINIRISIK